ncbi:hypothetical protein [sulfur-oxidizing endosymbiont of Gigantopelta aegis]|uniref:hypothetical protein n=1 Tax=sulfur-oxidizing endosymbiont of Gigantopelta aegis TaxID=2794934 RepID=UPI0018DD8C06|nr:hypothetical protein [sulfur-oxidizing endosymbiont of Gigantopelta aegis]
MTIEVDYIDGKRGVLIRLSNRVTGQEMINIHDEIYRSHQSVTQQYHIIDKSWCLEYDVTATEVRKLAELDCKLTQLNADIAIAVIESNYLQFNLTDVWQAYIEDCIKYSQSFKNQPDALDWLKCVLQDLNQSTLMSKKMSSNEWVNRIEGTSPLKH